MNKSRKRSCIIVDVDVDIDSVVYFNVAVTNFDCSRDLFYNGPYLVNHDLLGGSLLSALMKHIESLQLPLQTINQLPCIALYILLTASLLHQLLVETGREHVFVSASVSVDIGGIPMGRQFV